MYILISMFQFYVSVNYGNDIKLASEVIIGTIPLQDVFSPHYGIQYTPDGSAVVENEPSAPGASNMENPPYVPRKSKIITIYACLSRL